MVRISGVIMNPNKHLIIALRDIYGVGKYTSHLICSRLNLNPAIKMKDLDNDSISLLQNSVNTFKVEGELRRQVGMNIKRLIDIKSYKGIRHKLGLPVNGQRTRTNAMTRKKSRSKKK